MGSSNTFNTDELDRKIRKTKKAIDILKRASEILPKIESDLKILEDAKRVMAEKSYFQKEQTQEIKKITKRKKARGKNTIVSCLVEVLSDCGHSLHATELANELEEKGKTVSTITVTATCVRLVREGVLVKTDPNTFDLAGQMWQTSLFK